MKYCLLILVVLAYCPAYGQSKIPYPEPLVIDLSKPTASMPRNLDKKAKKKWKTLKKQQKLDAKNIDKLFADKLDSLQSSIVGDHTIVKSGLNLMESWPDIDLRKSIEDSLINLSALYKQEQILLLQDKYDLPDSLIQLSEKGLKHPDSLTIQDPIAIADVAFVNDSLYMNYINEVAYLEDSLSSVNYTKLAASLASKQLEQQLMSSDYFNNLALPENVNGADEALGSYEQMLNSDQYKRLMEDIPGKKKEIESFVNKDRIDLDSLPFKPDFFEGKEAQLALAQKNLTILKKKKSVREILRSFLNQDMESLEEKTFTQKFNIYGHLQLGGKDPILLDYSPSISYQLTGKSALGIGASGRLKIGDEPSDEKDLLAYRAFFDYTLLGSIFVHTEWERTGLKEINPVTDQDERIWSDRWLLGLGKDFDFGNNVNGNILILYNFNANEETPHSQRFQVRYGFKL